MSLLRVFLVLLPFVVLIALFLVRSSFSEFTHRATPSFPATLDEGGQAEAPPSIPGATGDDGLSFSVCNFGSLSPLPSADICGVVAAFNAEADVLVVSVGTDDGVEEGHEVTIQRGNQSIGKAKVTRVTPDMAGARILWFESGQRIQVGDSATILSAR